MNFFGCQKNAPSFFQRCVDDSLRPYVNKFEYIYINDVLIYFSTPEEHIEHIETIVNDLHEAYEDFKRKIKIA